MLGITLRGLARRKLRAVLTGLAVVIGVAMISGTYILTDTISGAFGKIFERAYVGSDAVVTPKAVVDSSTSDRPTISPETVARIAARDDVAAASGQVADETGARLLGRDGAPIDTKGAPSLALGIDPDLPRFSPVTVTEGRLARGPDEVLVDEQTAREQGFRVGGAVRVQTGDGPRAFTVSGVGSFGGASLGSATVAVFDVPTAQALLARGDGVDEVHVAAASGTSDDELAARLAGTLPPSLEVRTGAEEAAQQTADVERDLSFINYFLLAFAGVALFVGSFVIHNTLSITVAQRTRELATLRTLGASRRQVTRSVVAEALVVGAASSVVGLGAGFGLAKGLNALFVALDVDLPTTSAVIETRTIVVSLAVGTLVTVLASVLPARAAGRIAPIAAMREGAQARQVARPRRRALVGGTLAAAGSVLLAVGVLGDLEVEPRLTLMAGGLIALFIGVAAVMPRIVGPIAGVLGRFMARIGGEAGRLGRENAVRTPARTAATASALMIGLALMTFVAVLGGGLRESGREALREQIAATHVVAKSTGFENLTPGVDRLAARAEGARRVSGIRGEIMGVDGEDVVASGVDPATLPGLYRFSWESGSDATLASLAADQVLLADAFAEDRGISVGRRVEVLSPAGVERTLTVAGTFRPSRFDPLVGDIVLQQGTFDAMVPRASDTLVLARMEGTAEEGTAALEESLGTFTDGAATSTERFVEERSASVNQLLNLLYVLLALSIVVSLFGLVNTLALSVVERTRELGLLRAVGMSRRQVRRMVRYEAVTTALIGATLGLPLGIGLAALVTRALAEFDVGFTVPVAGLVQLVVLAVVVGVAAAVLPGRRAARLDVLRSLQYE